MKHLFAIAAAACLLTGCGENYDGRYPIDTIRMRSEGAGRAELANETFPLNAWFEIESRGCFRVHEGGVTSTYPHIKIVKTDEGFDAVSDAPHGPGVFSWSFEKGEEEDGLCSLTFTYDGIHYLTMISKGRETR